MREEKGEIVTLKNLTFAPRQYEWIDAFTEPHP